jgi:hypothetical protein
MSSVMDKDEDLFIKHVALIFMQERGTTVGESRFKAWLEGPKGYLGRLTKDWDKNCEGDC